MCFFGTLFLAASAQAQLFSNETAVASTGLSMEELEKKYPIPNPTPEQVQRSKDIVEQNAKSVYAYLPGDWTKEQLRDHMVQWVNPLTGCEYLAAYTSDLIEAVIFMEEYRRIYPYEKTWFLTRSANVGDGSIPYALFSHKGYLYIHSRLIGDQRVMPQKLTSQHIHDIENNDLMDGLQKVVNRHWQREKSIVAFTSMGPMSFSGGDFDDEDVMVSMDPAQEEVFSDSAPSMEDFERERDGSFFTFQPKVHYRDKKYPEEQIPINQMYRALRVLKTLGIPARIWRPNSELLEVVELRQTAYLMFIYENRAYLWNPEQTYGKYIGCRPNPRVDPALETMMVYANTRELYLVDDLELETFVKDGKFYAVAHTGKAYYDPLLAEYVEDPSFSRDKDYLVKIFENFGKTEAKPFAFRYMPSVSGINPENERKLGSVKNLLRRTQAKRLFSRIEYGDGLIHLRRGKTWLLYTEEGGLQVDSSNGPKKKRRR